MCYASFRRCLPQQRRGKGGGGARWSSHLFMAMGMNLRMSTPGNSRAQFAESVMPASSSGTTSMPCTGPARHHLASMLDLSPCPGLRTGPPLQFRGWQAPLHARQPRADMLAVLLTQHEPCRQFRRYQLALDASSAARAEWHEPELTLHGVPDSRHKLRGWYKCSSISCAHHEGNLNSEARSIEGLTPTSRAITGRSSHNILTGILTPPGGVLSQAHAGRLACSPASRNRTRRCLSQPAPPVLCPDPRCGLVSQGASGAGLGCSI